MEGSVEMRMPELHGIVIFAVKTVKDYLSHGILRLQINVDLVDSKEH